MNMAAISMKQLDELIAGGFAGYFFPFFFFFSPKKMLCLKETSFYERCSVHSYGIKTGLKFNSILQVESR